MPPKVSKPNSKLVISNLINHIRRSCIYFVQGDSEAFDDDDDDDDEEEEKEVKKKRGNRGRKTKKTSKVPTLKIKLGKRKRGSSVSTPL